MHARPTEMALHDAPDPVDKSALPAKEDCGCAARDCALRIEELRDSQQTLRQQSVETCGGARTCFAT